ncbi:UNVERIFIED_CONTAM: hypothetical protein Sradi_4149600 [Sesamum radiatum]|uniref:Secreted protein n=1 Tax=Sesamum radiatum TaxID=300843 RepID=A0AAW2P511_SESRA
MTKASLLHSLLGSKSCQLNEISSCLSQLTLWILVGVCQLFSVAARRNAFLALAESLPAGPPRNHGDNTCCGEIVAV